MTTEKFIPLHILDKITNGFSVNSIIGTGGYGNVYKGVHDGREIAVKLLHVDTVHGLDDQQFKNEVGNLLRVQHQNIVQLVGYCYETRKIYVKHESANNLSEHIYRVICFEYLQGGSLDKRLFDQSFAPNWSTRYNIIKGISEGLKFLHGREPPILHLDLKPANILLDSSMEPKVADFGLSRLFTQAHTHATQRIIGTRKYMPPECIDDHKISPKNDVFSLGVVMIDIMTGPAGYSSSYDMGDLAQLMQQVLAKWSTAIEATSKYPSDEKLQVQTCIKLAIRCVDSERDNRPYVADIVDTLNKTEKNIPKRQLVDVPLYPAIGPENTMDNTLKMTRDEPDNMTNKHQNCNFMPKDSFNFNVQQVPDIRETSSSMEEELIIGRTKEKQKILSILSESMTKEMVILPIYGIGGIGKTTLAQLVFHDTQFHEYSRVWVYISQEFDLKKIGNSIVSQLTKQASYIADRQILQNRLGELFAGKSILIVLDDLWEDKPYELDKLKDMLRPRTGSMVAIVTTRDEAIATKTRMNVMPYKLEILTVDMCWTIIKQKSFFEDRDDKKMLENIGRDIAIKCGGVALAAQSLGYMLRDKKSDQWESVRDSYIWNLSTTEGPSSRNHEVLVSLLLSYSHMHEFLQLCFSYCAVFQKGHNIVKYDLIHQWIALGFTEHSNTFDSIQLCEIYIKHLLGMSFLQYSKTRRISSDDEDKDVTLFTMHDLVHDLARAILADQLNNMGNVVGNRCQYALLTDCSKPLQVSDSSTEISNLKFFLNQFQKKSSPNNLKALRFLGSGTLELHGHAFSPAECLLVLDLSECFIRKLPESIGRLKQLKYLHAPRIKDHVFPDCISKLTGLNYLNLRGSFINKLPESIGDLKGLVHLDLSGCSMILKLPTSFEKLKQLVHLDLSDCSVTISSGICRTIITKAFCGFTKLQYLNLSHGVSIFTDQMGNLNKLRYFYLSRCLNRRNYGIDDFLKSLSTLSNLEHLDLSENYKLLRIPESMGNLRKLHTLDLSVCRNLEKLPDSIANMVSLKVLNVKSCFRLDESMLPVLNVASLPRFVVYASSDKCSSNIILLQPTNPVELVIDKLENVKSAEEAQGIKLREKQKIEELKFLWTVAAGRFVDDKEVLEKLMPPSSVQILHITGYINASIPDWLMGIRQYLPNLSKIDLCDFPNCSNLSPLGELANLQWLSLCRMMGLEEWNTTYTSGEEGENELLFPKLEKLTIKHCAKLRIKPCLPASAMFYEIVDCDNVISSWGESSFSSASSSSPVTSLIVAKSKVPLHQWSLLHQLPALRSLSISDCSDLTASPEIIQHLSSLQSLTLMYNYQAELPSWFFELTSLHALILYECRSMTSLPQWLGKLASLERFEIYCCKEIKSLPDSIQQLTNLEHLIIRGCPTLREWCESEENKMKLAHIRKRNIGAANTWTDIHCSVETTNNVDTASGSKINNKGKKPVNMEETIDLIDELHTDLLYSAVMNMPGFTEEALLVALSHLMDNNSQGSAYMGMHEEDRLSWLMNFLKRHY